MNIPTLLAMAALVPATAWTSYLTALAISGVVASRRRPPRGHATRRFAVLVPAHNEAANIGETVASLLKALKASQQLGAVHVIADNCADDTARVAAEAGARVIVRTHATERGKGYALAHAYGLLRDDTDWDVVVVVDADTIVDPLFFRRLAARFAAGARAVQAHYRPRALRRSWRTDMIAVAWSLFNGLRPMGRSGLGGTAGIYGNGFALCREAIEHSPFESHGLTEDAEQCLELLVRGVRVEFAPETAVYGLVEADAGASRSQRVRWESGRVQLAAAWLPRLMGMMMRRPSLALADAIADLATPPLAVVVLAIVAALGLALVGSAWALALVAGVLLAVVALVILVATRVAGLPLRQVASLAHAPAYVAWKLMLYASPSFWRQRTWVRTQRAGGPA